MKAVVAAFNQEKALVGAFSVITNLRMELFEALDRRANGANSGCNKNSGSSNHHSQLYSLFSLGMKINDLVNK